MPGSGGQPAPSVAELLGQAPIFAALTERHLRALAKMASVVSFPANGQVVRQGEPGTALYIVLTGRAEVRQGARPLATLGPGQFFGEMTLLDEHPRSADVVALEPVQCAVLSRQDFWGFAKGEPEVLQGVGREMARRLREANRSLSE